MRGDIGFYDGATERVHGIGLIHFEDDEGIMAVYEQEEGDPYSTYYFSHEDVEADGDFGEPAFLDEDEIYEGDFGNGDEWGQEMDGYTWELYSYNDEGDGPDDEWTDGDYTVFYVEGSYGEYSGFSADIYIDYMDMGAKQLLATTATASLMLALF